MLLTLLYKHDDDDDCRYSYNKVSDEDEDNKRHHCRSGKYQCWH